MKKTGLLGTLLAIIWLCSLTYGQDFQVTFDDDFVSAKKDSSDSVIKTSMVPIQDTLRMLIVEKAREFLGANYKWGHASGNAFDCSGYVKYVYEQFGFMLPHSSLEQYHISRKVNNSTIRPGDLVFFITRGQHISHVGIYIGENSFIHAPRTGKHVQIDSLENEYFRKHLAGFGTLL